jgi:hypothetical protein
MSDDIDTQDSTVTDHGPGTASGEVRSDAAGQTTGPPGSGDVDEQALAAGRERLEQAGGGH